MAQRETSTNDSTGWIYCPLRQCGCTDSFHPSKTYEHYTSEAHMKSLIGIICARRLTHESVLENLTINPHLIDELVPASHSTSMQYFELMERLTSSMLEICGSSSSANNSFCDLEHLNQNFIDNLIRDLVQRTDRCSHHDLARRSLQTQEQLNNMRMTEIHSLIDPTHDSTDAHQSMEAPGQNHHPPASNEPNDTQLSMTFQRMLQIQTNETPVSTDGLLIWPVDGICAKITDAIYRKSCYIDSALFQTHMNGHRFWARFYPNGKTDFRYLSFEAHLESPLNSLFRGRITFTLVDRSVGCPLEHVTKSCHVTDNDDRGWFGFNEFADKNVLHGEPSRFICNDAICLLVRIDQTEQEKFANLDPNVQHALLHSNRI